MGLCRQLLHREIVAERRWKGAAGGGPFLFERWQFRLTSLEKHAVRSRTFAAPAVTSTGKVDGKVSHHFKNEGIAPPAGPIKFAQGPIALCSARLRRWGRCRRSSEDGNH